MSQTVVTCSCPNCDTHVDIQVESRSQAGDGGATSSELLGRTATCRACGVDFDFLYYDADSLTRDQSPAMFQ